jgi:hypothetical protein
LKIIGKNKLAHYHGELSTSSDAFDLKANIIRSHSEYVQDIYRLACTNDRWLLKI